jgi:hypothetical protein
MPFPPPPSSIAVVIVVLLGFCAMAAVLGYDGYNMYVAHSKQVEEQRRLGSLGPARRTSVAEIFGLGGHSHSKGHGKGDSKLKQRGKGSMSEGH